METLSINQRAVEGLSELGFPLPKIRRALQELVDIPQVEVARKAGIYRTGVSKYISGLRRKRANLETIADIYEVPVEVFFADVIENS